MTISRMTRERKGLEIDEGDQIRPDQYSLGVFSLGTKYVRIG